MSSDLFLAQFEKGEIINSNSLMASRSFVGKDLYFGDTSNISNNILPISLGVIDCFGPPIGSIFRHLVLSLIHDRIYSDKSFSEIGLHCVICPSPK